jgi:hypothetical protein
MGGPKPKGWAGAHWVDYEQGGILKRDRLVSGLVHINAVHTPNRYTDNRKSIALSFVDSIGAIYATGSGTVGNYIKIHFAAARYSIFWFNPYGNNTAPINPGADEIVEVDISAFHGNADENHLIADEFESEFGTSVAVNSYRLKQGEVTIGDDKNNHIIFLRYYGTPEVISDATDTIGGDFSISQTSGASGTYDQDDAYTKETDFKQALFNNTSKDVGGVETYSRRSPFDSSEAPPWRGELYDDGRFNTGVNDDSHSAESRNKAKTTSASTGASDYDTSQGYYNASMGDHCTFLYHMTAATRIQDNPRLWGTRISNDNTMDILNDNGHPPVWIGDFDASGDLSSWTDVEAGGNTITQAFAAAPTDGEQYPEDTGCLVVTHTGSTIGDHIRDYGSYGVRVDSQAVTPGVDYRLTWDVDHNTDGSLAPGSGLIGIEVRSHASYSLGSSVKSIPGGGTGAAGVATQGSATFTCPIGVSTFYIFFLHNPVSGTIGGGNMVWAGGQFEVNMVSLKLDSAPHYSDLLNFKFGTPLNNQWYTSKPDDGLSFFWIRSHLISVHNNSEMNNDEFIMKSHRVTFNATSDAGEEAGLVDLGYNGSFPGSYLPHGVDVVDNYNYRQWKNYKPGDLIRISGAADAGNNGIFQIRWDWDHSSEYYIGYNADFPSTGDEWPNMQFRLCPFKIEENGDKTDPHTLVSTELVGQLFEEDITITTPGQYASTAQNKRYPLLFTATPAVVDVRGYAVMENQLSPSVDRIVITNPGIGFNSTSAASLVITVEASNGSSVVVNALSSGGTGYTSVETNTDHGLEEGQAVELFNMTVGTYDGEYTVESVTDATNFIIEKAFTVTATGDCRALGISGIVDAVFSHTAAANINTSPLITIENLTRRYQDSSNSKVFDYSIPDLAVEDPPPTGVDVHAVPYVGRYGNTGRVSSLNHLYDAYDDEFTGLYTCGRRDEMFSQQHEYEGRLATHHKMETWHNPVSGTPEIYGKRSFSISHSKNVYDFKIKDKYDDLTTNGDYIEEFSNGKFGTDKGTGYDLYKSPYYNRVYNVSQIEFGEAKVIVRVPIKAYETQTETDKGTRLFDEPLYDTHIDVMWQPFGQTGMIKLTPGEAPSEDLT